MALQLIKVTFLYSLLLFTTGCSTISRLFTADKPKPALNQVIPAAKRQQQLKHIQRWKAEGAISVTFNNRTDMGAFNWQQTGQRYNFKLTGPMNLGGFRLKGQPGHVVLYKADKRRTATTPEALMQSKLGWSLPMSNFFYWSRGMAAPNLPANEQKDVYGHLQSLSQQGWQIHYLRYQSVQGTDMPRSIVFSHPRVRLKIVIKKWQLPTP